MPSRFTAFAAMGALTLLAACSSKVDTSFLASDAHAESTAPSTAETVRQSGPMPSLAPLVKQLRPVVVNINSRFKPRRPRVAQRMPQVRPRVPQDDDNGDDGSDDGQQQDPMERFFRFFGPNGPQQDNQERHGLGSGFLIGEGLVLTNNHVVEVPDENRQGRYRAMD